MSICNSDDDPFGIVYKMNEWFFIDMWRLQNGENTSKEQISALFWYYCRKQKYSLFDDLNYILFILENHSECLTLEDLETGLNEMIGRKGNLENILKYGKDNMEKEEENEYKCEYSLVKEVKKEIEGRIKKLVK